MQFFEVLCFRSWSREDKIEYLGYWGTEKLRCFYRKFTKFVILAWSNGKFFTVNLRKWTFFPVPPFVGKSSKVDRST